ncbi:MAG: Sir2 family NAD-dependent protein deacetylase, partial [Rikenellaceae bacterium]
QQKLNVRHADGSLLRPFVVFFGEGVPMLEKAIDIVRSADILIVVGTSLAVYPAASLVHYVKDSTVPIYLVDPADRAISNISNKVIHIKERSAIGVPKLVDQLLSICL